MLPIFASIGGLLVDKGVDLIGSLFTKGAEEGIDKVTDLVKDVTGIDLKDEETVTNLTPEQVVKLQEIETIHKKAILEALVAEKKLDVDNTISARNMQMESIKQGGFQSYFTQILALILIIFSLTYITVITFIEIPEQNIRFVDVTLGFLLGTIVATIINFYFGSAMASTSNISTYIGDRRNTTTKG